jgi:ATP-binding cassette subfamily F protein 3
VANLRADAKKCEDRLDKLNRMLKTIDDKLGDGLQKGMMSATEVERISMKRAEVVQAVERAESLWMAALEKLEAAEAA